MTRALRALRNEEGIALAAVIGIGMVLTVLVASMLTLSTSGAIKSGTDRDASNATAAAYAGLADYQSRMTANNAYGSYGVLTSFNTGSTFQGTNNNPAFATTTSGPWAQVINSGGTESYRYEVDNSQFSANGTLRLRVTGRAGTVTRSLVANLRGTGFINYLYFTDFESQNPAITGEKQSGSTTKLCTSQHITDITYNSSTACKPVQFGTGDLLSGPVKTNDEFTICGTHFQKIVLSTAKTTPSYVLAGGCNTQPTFDAGPPQYASSFQLPGTNGSMLQETRSDLTATTVPRPGCLYTGPTSITFTPDGKMTVISPWTLATQIAIASNGTMSGTAPLACGTLTALHSSAGATITVPASNLVYVQTVPGSNTNSDPNYWASSAQPTSPTSAALCTKTVTTTVNGKTTTTTTYGNGLTNAATGLTYPATNEYAGPAGPQTTYGCRNGDVFVQGNFHGALTVGAQNNVYVTGKLWYTNTSTDILGLVGQNTVTVWNPISCSSLNNGVCSAGTLLARSAGANLEIDAAIASNGGTFQVQNYNFGAALGTLTVMGSIAQKFRGAVATTSGGTRVTGFLKSYGYDQRLQNTAPPKFLQPVATTYGVTTEIAVKSAFSANGTPTP